VATNSGGARKVLNRPFFRGGCPAKPWACAWTERCEDLSGLEISEADWIDPDAPPSTLVELLAEIGRVYAPFMIANADALFARA
jgi:hypothetical protein